MEINAPVKDGVHPGEYLRQIRIQRRIELADVVKELNIPIKLLVALEQDDYQALPEVIFIKGYYRNYAKLLKVDAEPLIQRFDEVYTQDTGRAPYHGLDESPMNIRVKLSERKPVRSYAWLKYVLLLVLLAALAWMGVTLLKNRQAPTPPVSELQAVDVLAEPTPVATADKADALVLHFNRPTSVYIVDAKGDVLLAGRQANKASVSGQQPFQIRLDDAGAVSLSLNDENISLSPYIVNGKAEFQLSR
jgi:hypothetical protein